MNNDKIHTDSSGSLPKPKTQSPRAIYAWAQAREGFARVILAGIVLALLTLSYIVALFCKIEGAQSILLVVGSGIGFLLGRSDRAGGSSE